MRMPHCLLAVALMLPGVVAAKVYRWVDAKGQVHYSQVPPASGRFETLTPAAPRTPGGAEPAPGGADSTRAFLERAEAEQRARDQAAAQQRAAMAEARAQCDRASARLAYLDERTPRRLAIENPDGSMARMDEVEFARRRDTAQREVDTHCRGEQSSGQ